MEKREMDFIAKDLWERELEFRKDPKNAYDVQVEQEFFNELNVLGFNFTWSCQFDASVFSEKDKAIIPIFIKYLNKFKNADLRIDYLACLGVKGFYDATEYLIEEYRKNISPTYNSSNLNFVSQTIAKIRDERFIDTYIDFLRDDIVVAETGYIVEMLGLMKFEKAVPHLIRLLDRENPIDAFYLGTTIERTKYVVSQRAIEALSRFKNPEFIKHIEKFLEPQKLSWICFSESKEKRANLKETYKEYIKVTLKAIKKMKSISE